MNIVDVAYFEVRYDYKQKTVHRINYQATKGNASSIFISPYCCTSSYFLMPDYAFLCGKDVLLNVRKISFRALCHFTEL